MENETQITPLIEQKEYVKLSKMSKGYNWEIKLLPIIEGTKILFEDIGRLESLDLEMRKKFGDKNEN